MVECPQNIHDMGTISENFSCHCQCALFNPGEVSFQDNITQSNLGFILKNIKYDLGALLLIWSYYFSGFGKTIKLNLIRLKDRTFPYTESLKDIFI